jgi:hypothetical protein
MKTLIIHPKDKSTQFLDIVYEPIPNKTIITGGITKEEVVKLIEEHDRVMMCGHGAPMGLFSVGQFKNTGGFIIDHTMVDILSKKDNSIFIWCNADQFVNRFKLKGFYSGMFISEVGEAYYCGLPGTKQDVVDESNFGFCELLSECINEPHDVMYCRFNWFNIGCGGKGSRNVTLFFARRLRWLQLVSDFLFGELTQEATAGPQGGNCLAKKMKIILVYSSISSIFV